MKTLTKALSLILALAISGAVFAQETPATLDGVKVVSAEQVRDMASKGVPLVDTRAALEYAEKSAKGAISVPYKEKSVKDATFDRTQDKFDLTKLPEDKSKPIVFFCNSGTCWKSYKASVLARDAGYKQVQWFRGGMPEWNHKSLPTQ
ncbi:MAG: rhodanese-like domain-containing protein [Burkholderiaceae bacterium]|nr:rhodanese-like domain-containing protein [Burkholderiaceae bacterium]MDZ4144142.1 rhodanese-like domain-containing protein [Burkholderiales bacterium]